MIIRKGCGVLIYSAGQGLIVKYSDLRSLQVEVNLFLFLRHSDLRCLQVEVNLDFGTLWANSADDKLVIFFIILPRRQLA